MGKIVTILLLTALAMFMARMAYDAPFADFEHTGSIALETTATVSAPLMYAGVRG